jgi:hypothetical protein
MKNLTQSIIDRFKDQKDDRDNNREFFPPDCAACPCLTGRQAPQAKKRGVIFVGDF